MPISFHCPQCGKSYTTSDETAGKRARCKECGNTMTIPRPRGADPRGFAAPPPRPSSALHDDDEDVLPARATYRTPKKTSSGSGGSAKSVGGAVSVIGVVVILVKVGLRMLLHMHRGHAAPAPPPPVPAAAAVNPHGPIALPAFPDPGPGQALEAGVAFHEIRLPNGPKPGSGKRLWLYLPPGAPANHALPCVLITGAGSPLVLGMDLGPGDRPEHLPYVRAGFAVLAFELDGGLNGVQNASDAQFFAAARRFLAARAGLANARIALEYVLAKVPQVDPQRVFVAGHSSAGTLALLFAEHEPRLKGCVAFAPPIDLAQRLHQLAPALRQQGLIDLVERYSPKNNEANLACPLFLFHALDDTNTPVRGSLDCVQRLQGMGKDVTLVTVATGGHYQSMIDEGIPRAIAWLQARAGTEPPGVGAAPPQPAAIPAPAPTPPVPTTNNEPGQWGNPPDGRGGFPIPRRGPRIAPPPHFRGPRFAPPRFAPPGMPPHP